MTVNVTQAPPDSRKGTSWTRRGKKKDGVGERRGKGVRVLQALNLFIQKVALQGKDEFEDHNLISLNTAEGGWVAQVG